MKPTSRFTFAIPLMVAASMLVGKLHCNAAELQSPDGRLVAQIDVNDRGDFAHLLSYSVSWNGASVVVPSSLGLDIEKMPSNTGLKVVGVDTQTNNQTWKTVSGERSEVRDHFNETTLHLQTLGDQPREIDIKFRAYNEGLAFRYSIPKQSNLDQITINRELSEFRFPADHKTWVVYNAQGEYEEVTLSQVKPGCERPLTIQADDDRYLAIGEAALVDYARMKFAPLKGVDHGLVSQLQGKVQSNLPLETPWRFIMVANRPGQLIENNHLVLNLNEPCAIEDTSWIKPGKVIRELTLTTDGGKALVDFAVDHQIEFIHFDAGWYGNEFETSSDATTVTVDPKRSPGPLDIHEVIAYAKKHDIGVIVYVNRRALETQLDEILPLYKSWGIAGIKYGFVNVGSQQWTTWLHDAIRKAAEHQLMVDVHDEYRPTGYERTYPNLMTAEGIAGDETSPKNPNTLTILFTRMLCGPADNTVCYYNQRVDQNATHAYQLAKAVCIYSPWQYLYWYDRPATASDVGGAGGGTGRIGDEPELEFFDLLPATWDETRVIEGEIGKYAVIARRSGDQWFIGAMNSGTDDGSTTRAIKLPLDFLAKDKKYKAHRYIDDPSIDTRTKVRIDRSEVDQSTVIELTLSKQGGEAIRIEPML